MANSITNAFLGLLLALLAAAAAPAQAEEMPDWFAETLLDVREEVADAAKDGKRLMLYFWQEGCPYCQKMTSVTFRDAAVVERLKRGFVPVGINTRGDREIAWTDGKMVSEKQLAAMLKVRGTPTLVFFDEKGAIVLRLTGYVAPAQFAPALDTAAGKPPG